MDYRTARLSLHAVDELEARRIRDRVHPNQATIGQPTTRSEETWLPSAPFCALPSRTASSVRSATTRSGFTPTVWLSVALASKDPPMATSLRSATDWRRPREDTATRRKHWEASCRLPSISA
jgi:hypothetical protein